MEPVSSLKNKKPTVALLANCTSPINKKHLIAELGEPENGFFKPLNFSFRDIAGEIIALDILPNEILEKSGMEKAKKYMSAALEYLVKKDIKVIAFTASTKRLPGKSGQEIKELYPDVVFTIGDNGTIISFLKLIDHFLPFINKNDHVACMGVGFLGERVVEHLVAAGCENLSILTQQKLSNLPGNVKVVKSIEEMSGDIKMFLSCTHKYDINPQAFNNLISPNGIIIDVAVPPGINQKVFSALPRTVLRFDAGDFYLDDIRIDFPVEILSFPRVGFWYGCWTEAVMLAQALSLGENLKKFNFFEVNGENQELVTKYLKTEKVSVPLINFFNADGMNNVFNF
jgi:hypothetical protein